LEQRRANGDDSEEAVSRGKVNKLQLAKAYLYVKREGLGGKGQETKFAAVKRLLKSQMSVKALSLACWKWRTANPEAWQRMQAEAEKDPLNYFRREKALAEENPDSYFREIVSELFLFSPLDSPFGDGRPLIDSSNRARRSWRLEMGRLIRCLCMDDARQWGSQNGRYGQCV
jgi:hypothetical protein